MNYTFTDEDIKLVERLIEIKNRGYYADGKQVTEVYNRVLGKKVNPTNCGSCIRQRVSELEGALNHFKAINASNENKAVDESSPKEIEDVKVRAAKKNNKK